MSRSDVVLLVTIAVLIVLAGFFALAETALTRVSRVKAITLEEEGKRGAHLLVRLAEHTERFLNPILLLLLVCHLAAGTLVGVFTARHFGAAGVAVGLFVEVIFIFVLAEAAPKTWAIQHTERAALLAAPVVNAIASFPPIRVLAEGLIGLANAILPGKGLKKGPFVSEQELLATVDVALEDEVIEREERVHPLDHRVRRHGRARGDGAAARHGDRRGRDKIGDVLEVAIAAGRSRIPIYEQGIDDIVGIVFTKDLIRAVRDGHVDAPVRELAREAHFVPETKRVAELMREMQREKFHMAIVVDEYGGTAGLVTLEDLIEELVGEIVDEFDVEDPCSRRYPVAFTASVRGCRSTKSMTCCTPNSPTGIGTRSADWCSTCWAMCRRRAKRSTTTATDSLQRKSRAGGSVASGSFPYRSPSRNCSAASDDRVPLRLCDPRRPAERR